jgi:hypothetical protein
MALPRGVHQFGVEVIEWRVICRDRSLPESAHRLRSGASMQLPTAPTLAFR